MAKNNPQPASETPKADVALYGTDTLPAHVELIEGATVALGDIVRRAAEDKKLGASAWNELSQKDRDDAILAARDALADEAKKAVEEGAVVECAVLYDSQYGKHDEIILLAPEAAELLGSHGFVDPHPNAIKAIRDARKGKVSA